MKRKLFFLLVLLILASCKKDNQKYFPLKNGHIWNYNVVINPGVEDKINYKKINSSIEGTLIKKPGIEETIPVHPILREDDSIYYYSKNKNGIFREGIQFKRESPVIFEKNKKYVLKYPIKIGTKWNSVSKTFLIIRRYAYFDYRATTMFDINYEIKSLTETIKVPAGNFKNCVKVVGKGETTFIGDREIGSIKIKIMTNDWYAPKVGLVKSIRWEETDSDLFGKSKMVQVLDDFK